MPNDRVVAMRFLTVDEARELKKGDIVVTPYSDPAWKPYRVTDVYAEPGKTPMVRIHKLAMLGQWLHATGFCMAPKDAHWDVRYGWIEGTTEFGERLTPRLENE